MRKSNDLAHIVKTIADALNEGLSIGFVTIDGEQGVVVADSEGGYEIAATVKHPRIFHPRDYRFVYGAKSDQNAEQPSQQAKPVTSLPDKAMPTVDTIGQKKHNSRWWSRFHLEKNIMKMTLLALQGRYPVQESFPQQVFAARLARMMGWKTSTARKHITRAAKMGIISRAVIGTTYHITGINDVDVKTAQDTVADRDEKPEYMPMPGEDCDEDLDKARPAFYREFLDEGKPALELEREKALNQRPQSQTIRFDESLLP